MAFQIGETKLQGTFDGLNFYRSVYGYLVRSKPGPTTKQFQTAVAFQRSRENSAEFTRCASLAGKIRRLVIQATGVKDKTLHHRLMKLLCALTKADPTSMRGKRDPLIGMKTGEGRLMLRLFSLTAGSLIDILITAGFLEIEVPHPAKEGIEKPREAERIKEKEVIKTLLNEQPMKSLVSVIGADAPTSWQQRPLSPSKRRFNHFPSTLPFDKLRGHKGLRADSPTNMGIHGRMQHNLVILRSKEFR